MNTVLRVCASEAKRRRSSISLSSVAKRFFNTALTLLCRSRGVEGRQNAHASSCHPATTKVITITPEGVSCSNVHEHGKSVERYRLDVIQGSRGDGDAKG